MLYTDRPIDILILVTCLGDELINRYTERLTKTSSKQDKVFNKKSIKSIQLAYEGIHLKGLENYYPKTSYKEVFSIFSNSLEEVYNKQCINITLAIKKQMDIEYIPDTKN